MRTEKVRDIASLQELHGRLSRFRQEKSKGERVPVDLWREVAAEAQRHSVSFVAKFLSLDFYQVKSHANKIENETEIEKLPAHTKTQTQTALQQPCIIAFENQQGMKVHIPTTHPIFEKMMSKFMGEN